MAFCFSCENDGAKLQLKILFSFPLNLIMPKIYQYLNYGIFIYTNDHLPLHVHIFIQYRQVKAELIWINSNLEIHFKKIKGYKPLTTSECKEVAIFVKEYEKQIK